MKTRKSRKSRTFRRVRQNRRRSSVKRGGVFSFMKPTKTGQASTTGQASATGQAQEPKKYGSLASGLTSSVIRSAKAYNMPAILGAMSSKINALLIHDKVNYVFSNGYNARDYDIESEPANGNNDGRGILKQNSVRGEITGVQSKVFNKGLDAYSQVKNKNTTTQIK